jgi:pimeloyl-ACP methyl ester carboxylesterase
MARYILIHGAWGNAASWLRLVPLLEARGQSVEALDLPGHGADATPPDTVGMAAYVAAVEAVLLDGPPAILVGHSMGGIVIAQVAANQPAHVIRCVYVAALLPRDGESLISLIMQQETDGIQPAVMRGPVRGTTLLDPALAGPILCQDASAKDQTGALAGMSPQSNQAQKDGAIIGPEFAQVSRAYVFCSEDRTVTYALQKQMVAATPCAPTFTLNCGHMPQLTQARALADILLELDE